MNHLKWQASGKNRGLYKEFIEHQETGSRTETQPRRILFLFYLLQGQKLRSVALRKMKNGGLVIQCLISADVAFELRTIKSHFWSYSEMIK